LVGGWSANLGPKKTSYHQRGYVHVTVAGDEAVAVSNGYAWNRMEGNGDPLWEVWGRYEHTLTRTGAGWKVDGMTFEATHERGNMWVRDTPSPAN
ncbi:MAG: nuclear transport factor 2 family protein, partial [Pseudomonadota bacterium]